MNTSKAITTYCLTSYVYAAFRKALQLWDAKIERRIQGFEYKTTNMLLGEKLGVFGVSVILAPGLLPFHVMSDLNRIDIYLSGQRPMDYGFSQPPSHILEHIFN